mgnify:CR=1 FL=1
MTSADILPQLPVKRGPVPPPGGAPSDSLTVDGGGSDVLRNFAYPETDISGAADNIVPGSVKEGYLMKQGAVLDHGPF